MNSMNLTVLLVLLMGVYSSDCDTACTGVENDADFKSCIDNCNRKYLLVIITTSVASALLLFCLGCCCYQHISSCMSRRSLLRSLHSKYDTHDQIEVISFGKSLSFLKNTLQSDHSFFFCFQQHKYYLKPNKIEWSQVSSTLSSIKLAGTDDMGKWKAKGAVKQNNKQLEIWLLLEHSHTKRARGIHSGLLLYGKEIQVGFGGKCSHLVDADTNLQGSWGIQLDCNQLADDVTLEIINH